MNSTSKNMLDFDFETDRGVAEALVKAINKAILLISDVDTALVQHAHFNDCAIFDAQSVLREAIDTLYSAQYSASEELGLNPPAYEVQAQSEDMEMLVMAMGLMRLADKPVTVSGDIDDLQLYPLSDDGTIDISKMPPCPVCESKELIMIVRAGKKEGVEYCIHCTDCGKETGWFASKKEVIDAWQGFYSNEDGHLKRCPFCGNSGIAVQKLTPDGDLPTGTDTFYYNVWCTRCNASVNNLANDTEEKAVGAWNRRARQEPHGSIIDWSVDYD